MSMSLDEQCLKEEASITRSQLQQIQDETNDAAGTLQVGRDDTLRKLRTMT